MAPGIVELARRAGTIKQSMGQLVTRMVSLGLVEVRAVPGPGRGRLVVATDKGWTAFRDGLDVVLAIHDRLTALLGPDDLTELVSSLRHLVDIVDASPP